MKTITLDLIEKNRVYFKCLTENGCEVKLKVTSKSESLLLGKQELLVRDCSVRTKYGTDAIYDVEEEIKDDRIITLKHRYNENLVEKCKNLGGRWDSDEKVWVFKGVVEDRVEELDALYNGEFIDIEITALRELNGQPTVDFMGYPLIKASGRDSDARICDDVSMISGKVGSGGSQKNWVAYVEEGTKFRLSVSKNLLLTITSSLKKWDVAVLQDFKKLNKDIIDHIENIKIKVLENELSENLKGLENQQKQVDGYANKGGCEELIKLHKERVSEFKERAEKNRLEIERHKLALAELNKL